MTKHNPFTIGTHVRGHHFTAGIVVGIEAKSRLPIVQFDGENSESTIHPSQLMTEAAYQAIITKHFTNKARAFTD